MAKNRSKCGINSTSKIIQGYLASHDNVLRLNNKQENFNNEFFCSGNLEIADEYKELKIATPILDALENYINNPSVPLHIPGHAKGEGIFPKFKKLIGQRAISLDTTDEFDNLGTLHPADGPIAKSQELTAQTFGASKSFFLINGSTVGNLALALTATKENQKVIIGRNCHRSVISGLVFTGANPIWVVPERLDEWGIWGAINPQEIKRLLDKNPDVGLVWITNPTYEGVVSDIASISSICKEKNVTLIVDEAHGCVWKFNKNLPTSALDNGADAVVHSMHKTGGSFSQSSVLHLGKNSSINPDELETNLRMLQSTSPSYILLASLDAARAYLSSQFGLNQLGNAVENANLIRESLNTLPGVKCLSPKNNIFIDPTKIYLKIDGLSGKRLESILEIEYHIEVEAATDVGILALSNIGNTHGELEYFWECIKSIVNSNYSDITYLEKIKYMPFHIPEIVCTPRAAYMSQKEKIPSKECIGRICAEIIAECPPGIPILMPGEKITLQHLPYLTKKESICVAKVPKAHSKVSNPSNQCHSEGFSPKNLTCDDKNEN
ncbi:MAG: aminotransferase class I/II-fold pyridoxal phosphate-dependent enzyme [bacterium]